MNIRPLDDRVVIKSVEAKEKTVGGIIIPDTAKEKPQMGEIIAVGNEEDLQKAVKVGDQILYAKYSGTEVEVDNVKYIIVSKSDILAVIE